MYTDLQIDCIRAFGDKELKEGCKIIEDNNRIYSFCYKTLDRDIYRFILYSYSEHRNKLGRFTDGKVQVEASFGKITEILGSEPHLFPDVAKKLREEGWELELGSIGGEYHILVHERGIQEAIIYFNPYIPLLEQPQAMEQLLSLIK